MQHLLPLTLHVNDRDKHLLLRALLFACKRQTPLLLPLHFLPYKTSTSYYPVCIQLHKKGTSLSGRFWSSSTGLDTRWAWRLRCGCESSGLQRQLTAWSRLHAQPRASVAQLQQTRCSRCSCFRLVGRFGLWMQAARWRPPQAAAAGRWRDQLAWQTERAE